MKYMIMVQPNPSYAGVRQQLSDEQQLAGLSLVERGPEQAVEIAAGVPDAAIGEVLVRPVLDLPR